MVYAPGANPLMFCVVALKLFGLDHEYLYGVVPPCISVISILPSAAPLQLIFSVKSVKLISIAGVIVSSTVVVQFALSVMVKLYVPALNPEKSKGPPSGISVNVFVVPSSVILYGAVPPDILPVIFPSESPKHESVSPNAATAKGVGSVIVCVMSVVASQLF